MVFLVFLENEVALDHLVYPECKDFLAILENQAKLYLDHLAETAYLDEMAFLVGLEIVVILDIQAKRACQALEYQLLDHKALVACLVILVMRAVLAYQVCLVDLDSKVIEATIVDDVPMESLD